MYGLRSSSQKTSTCRSSTNRIAMAASLSSGYVVRPAGPSTCSGFGSWASCPCPLSSRRGSACGMAVLLPGLAVPARSIFVRGWFGSFFETLENLGHSGAADAEVTSQSGTILHCAAVEKTLVELGQGERVAVNTGHPSGVFLTRFRGV